MGQSQIEIKITAELNKDIVNELQVVYILSRVRKLLEINKAKSKYPILNFYCNWVLHAEMTSTDGKSINSMFREFIEKPEEKQKLGFHLQFIDEFENFLINKQLPVPSSKNLKQFRFQMQKIISDTPIEVKTGTKYKIVFQEPLNAEKSGLHITTVID